MGKRQDNAKLTREKLIEAAKALDEQKGICRVSVDEIVELAGVSKGSFYTYFRRKEDIAVAITIRMSDWSCGEADKCGDDALKRITVFLERTAQSIEYYGLEICKQWMRGAVSPEYRNSEQTKRYLSDRDYICRCLLESGWERDQALRLADTIVSVYYGQTAAWCMCDGAFSLSQRMSAFCREHLPSLISTGSEAAL